MKVLVTKKQNYLVNQNEDGSLLITLGTDMPSIPNAGYLINSFGGVAGVMKAVRTVECSFEDFKISKEEANAEKLRVAKIVNEDRFKIEAAKREQRNALIADEYNALKADGVIEVNASNLRTVLRYLNTCNWGSWTLPPLSISYSAHQYDCDGVSATTITLDTPISDEEFGFENKTMFKTGGKRGHLNNYTAL